MIKLQYPWFFLLIIAPVFLQLLKRQDIFYVKALQFPYYQKLKSISAHNNRHSINKFTQTFLYLGWFFLILALTNPKWVDEPIMISNKGRDIMLAIDISGSMDYPDMLVNNQPIDRLSAVKNVAKEFVDKRKGDRIGLILFGTRAYLQTPLTFDRETIKKMIDDATTKLAGQYTAIGDAIGLAIKRFKGLDSNSKVIILLTDGANNTGVVEPLAAAKMAREFGIKIYTIGLGAQQIAVQGLFGTHIVNPSQDLDEETLKNIAHYTQGLFFRSTDYDSLKNVYSSIDKLEPNEKNTGMFRPEKSLYYLPLSIVFIITVILFIRKLGLTWRRN